MKTSFLIGLSLAMLAFGLCIAKAADTPKPDLKEIKIAILTAQRDASADQINIANAIHRGEQSQAVLQRVIADAAKALNCEIDPVTAECRPKAAPVPAPVK